MDGPNPRDVFRIPGYLAFWSAYTVSGFGTYITTLALQVLGLDGLGGTAAGVGLLNAARWLPYLAFGLVAGGLVDRRPRKPVLIGTDLARGILLLAIPVRSLPAAWSRSWELPSPSSQMPHPTYFPRWRSPGFAFWSPGKLPVRPCAVSARTSPRDSAGSTATASLHQWLSDPTCGSSPTACSERSSCPSSCSN